MSTFGKSNLKDATQSAIRKAVTSAARMLTPTPLGVGTGATRPGAKQQIPLDPVTGWPVDDYDGDAPPETGGGYFMAGDPVGVKPCK